MAEVKLLHCSKCGVNEKRSSHGWCKSCHNANMREWRKTHKLQGEARKKDIARSIAGVYKRAGKISIKPCEFCGAKAEMHHPDYGQALLIQWLCRKHHLELHKELSS